MNEQQRKRDRLEIIRDILAAIQKKGGEQVRPTHILYKSNLSSDMLKQYISELLTKELIKEEKQKHIKMYSLTQKGYEYLKDYKQIKAFLESYGLD